MPRYAHKQRLESNTMNHCEPLAGVGFSERNKMRKNGRPAPRDPRWSVRNNKQTPLERTARRPANGVDRGESLQPV